MSGERGRVAADAVVAGMIAVLRQHGLLVVPRDRLPGVLRAEMQRLAADLMAGLVGQSAHAVPAAATVHDCVEAAAEVVGVPVARVLAPHGKGALSEARWLAAVLAQQETGLSLPRIGRALGGRHHTTVLLALRYGAGLPPELVERGRAALRRRLAAGGAAQGLAHRSAEGAP